MLNVGCKDTWVDIGTDEGGDETLEGWIVAWLSDAWEDAKLETWLGSLTDINGGDVGVWGI